VCTERAWFVILCAAICQWCDSLGRQAQSCSDGVPMQVFFPVPDYAAEAAAQQAVPPPGLVENDTLVQNVTKLSCNMRDISSIGLMSLVTGYSGMLDA
jgi:hypothetical protein